MEVVKYMPFCNEYNHVRDAKDFTEQWLFIKSQIAITDSVPFTDFRFLWLLQEPKQNFKPRTRKIILFLAFPKQSSKNQMLELDELD